MIKKNNAVTLVVLVITLIIILVLAGVSYDTSYSLIKDVKWKSVVSNMYIIKSKAEAIYDEYEFSDDVSVLEGEAISDLSSYNITVQTDDLWYVWNIATLNKLGLDEKMLSDGSNFIVNYTTGEVVYTLGVQKNGELLYTLTDLLN